MKAEEYDFRIGDWVRYREDGEFHIAVIQYLELVDGKKMLLTDQGYIIVSQVREVKCRGEIFEVETARGK